MPEQQTPKARRLSPWIPGIFVLLTLTILILLQTSNIWKDFPVETASDTLLLYALSSLNFIAFVIFGFIFLRSITKLIRERRALQLGSRIKTRLSLYFAAVSLLPIVAMAGFSYLFMNRALERWFTQIPERVVREARDLQNQAVADQTAKLNDTARMLALTLETAGTSDRDLARIAREGNLTRIEITTPAYETVSVSQRDITHEQKQKLAETLSIFRTDGPAAPALHDGLGYDLAVVELTDGRKLLIVPDIKAGQTLSQRVDDSLREFDRLKDQQITVRQVGFLTLGVLTFLLIFASSWTAFYIARGLTTPIKALAEGAREIGRGKLGHRVDVLAEDELALLVSTFNEMSARLEANSTELLERRRYIETVIESLPTGVISLDQENRVTTINRAALKMLAIDSAETKGITSVLSDENRELIQRLVSRASRIGRASEQITIERSTSEGPVELPLAITATALPGAGGVVLVIEDLSELIAAQRASAWREVARRMAHEIKNPLTPIQLSAERIAKRFRESHAQISPIGGLLSVNDLQTSRVVKDGTETILREVRSLKAMVDEFSQFARLPEVVLQPGSLNEIILHVVSLYQDRSEGVTVETNLAPDMPEVFLDVEQMKRVFVNLVDNAYEAFDSGQFDKGITIVTRYDRARELAIAEISDNGPGIAPADFQKLFQPYFSTKGRGTGLGLAIVHHIIADHNGRITSSANRPQGARFTIEIPVVT